MHIYTQCTLSAAQFMDAYQQIAPYYDYEHDGFADDIAFYRSVIPRGSVIEVGAGTGRVMEPLARAGLEIWGVEPSGAMLERARERLRGMPNAHLVHGSLADLPDSTTFETALFTLNSLWHFPTLAEQVKALHTVRKHLNTDGLLVVDCSNPLSLADRGAAGEVRQRFRVRREQEEITCWSAAWDDEAAQILRLSLTYDTAGAAGVQRATAQLTLRYVYKGELDLMLGGAGFSVTRTFGSYGLDPYHAGSPGLILLAKTT